MASFQGNVGDVASHRAFRTWFESLFPNLEIQWIDIEIRKFYRDIDTAWEIFDEAVSRSNCLIIGGGNYLELWPENSPTGTSLPFSRKEMEDLSVPIFINSVGVDDGQGVGQSASQNFAKFINSFVDSKRNLLSVRNDGSLSVVKRFLNPENWNKCFELPDHAFFTNWTSEVTDFQKTRITIGINLAIDMPEIRFSKYNQDAFEFLSQLALTLNRLLDFYDILDLCFIPHMYSDMKAISFILGELKDTHRRERATVTTYDTRANSQEFTEAYSQLDGVVAMRFHSHVFGISKGIPVFSLNSYPQIEKLLKNVGLESIESYDFQDHYEVLADQLFSFVEEIVKKSVRTEQFEEFHAFIRLDREIAGVKIQQWLNSEAK
jgi:polysaccharide pyruvyl transferase WcaK-like protein